MPVLPGAMVGVPGTARLAEASPELLTVIATANVSPRGMLFGMESEAESAEGVCTVTVEDVAAGELTVLPSVASVPLADPLNVIGPGALPVKVYANAWLACPAIVAETGEGPIDRLAFPLPVRTMADGATAFAAESPEFVAVSVTWKDCPTLTDPAATVNPLARLAGVCTTTLAGVEVEAETACAVLTSVPLTVLEKVTVPTTSPRTDQVKTCELPPVIVALDGLGPERSVVAAPPIDSTGATPCAAASPEFLAVTVIFSACPVFATAGVAAIAADRAVGAWMSSDEVVAGAGSTAAFEFTSVADAPTVKRTGPVLVGDIVQMRVRVVSPGTV